MVALNKNAEATSLQLDRFADFVGENTQAHDALTGKTVTLGETLTLPGSSATLLEIK
jgi:hypothetical protein